MFASLRIQPAWRLLMALAVAGLAVSWCAEASAAQIRVGGTGSGSALMQHLIAQYAASHPGVAFTVVSPPLGSTGGLRALDAGTVDLVVSGRPLKPEEAKPGRTALDWARTPLVLATSGGQLTGGLHVDVLADILLDKRTAWDDGSPIRLVLRMPSESDMLELSAYDPRLKEALAKALAYPVAVTADTDLDAVDILQRTPHSLGTTTLGLLTLRGADLRTLPFDGQAPSLDALRAGTYRLGKTMHLIHNAVGSPELQAFLDWLTSPEAAALLRETNHEPLFP